MRGAEAVLACLREQDVDTVFGYPGGMILPLYDALYGQTAIRQILVTHEQNAAHAADGYARATGRDKSRDRYRDGVHGLDPDGGHHGTG